MTTERKNGYELLDDIIAYRKNIAFMIQLEAVRISHVQYKHKSNDGELLYGHLMEIHKVLEDKVPQLTYKQGRE